MVLANMNAQFCAIIFEMWAFHIQYTLYIDTENGLKSIPIFFVYLWLELLCGWARRSTYVPYLGSREIKINQKLS